MNKKEERDGIDFKRGSWVRIGGSIKAPRRWNRKETMCLTNWVVLVLDKRLFV